MLGNLGTLGFQAHIIASKSIADTRELLGEISAESGVAKRIFDLTKLRDGLDDGPLRNKIDAKIEHYDNILGDGPIKAYVDALNLEMRRITYLSQRQKSAIIAQRALSMIPEHVNAIELAYPDEIDNVLLGRSNVENDSDLKMNAFAGKSQIGRQRKQRKHKKAKKH